MKHLVVVAVALLVTTSLASVYPASAGLFDKLKKEVEEAVSDMAEEKAKETTA